MISMRNVALFEFRFEPKGAFWRKTSWASTWGGQERNCRQNVHEHYLIELNVILQILLDLYAKTYFEQFF